MEFFTIASSSSGNASLVREGDAALLIDAGVSARRITQSLASVGMSPEDLSAVLVTHTHSDHVSGIAALTKKYAVPVYASGAAARLLPCEEALLRTFVPPCTFSIGPFTVRSFPTSHDSAGSVDYRIDCADGSLGLLTDTGCVTPDAARLLPGVDTLLLEANHEIEMLRCGPYPYHLKRRILGDFGHLSNDTAAEFALECVKNGTRDILLAHLSAENNTPEIAEYTVARRLQSAGLSVRLSVAPRNCISEAHLVSRGPLREAR